MGGDRTGTPIRERTWIEKFDHDEDPPRLIETVFREIDHSTTPPTVTQTVYPAGAPMPGDRHEQKAAEDASAETRAENDAERRAATDAKSESLGSRSHEAAAVVPGPPSQQVKRPLDPIRGLAVLVRAAEECKLDVSKALRLTMTLAARSKQPDGAPPLDGIAVLVIANQIIAELGLDLEGSIRYLAIASAEIATGSGLSTQPKQVQ